MKPIILILLLAANFNQIAQSRYEVTPSSNQSVMKLNAGIITSKLSETKAFYQKALNFGITFENEWYVLLHTPDGKDQLSFLLPQQPSQKPIFQKQFTGQGVYLTIEVEDVDAEYKRIKDLGIPIEIELRDEPWGDRHFAIVDPNGIGIDIVKYTNPE
ncbi:VOC family protein [Foetidibacter luteolus]|uniref:VOC family protein n=1 Tax=Foetidibacter luteolus TaxID=2608880 RepID=UPI001F233C7B|nr:VOC family protein [Foetidibacter luteolus]